MLDTQVYSNTGGQNSDSTPMLGGSDMNVFGAATQGKSVEKKTVAETFLAGHGSPFVAQVSIANAPKLYKAILDALEYRGTAFLQCFTTCQPEHGVADDMSLDAGAAGARLAGRARVRLQPPRWARRTPRRSTSTATRPGTGTGTRRSSSRPGSPTATPWRTGARRRPGSGTTSRRSSRRRRRSSSRSRTCWCASPRTTSCTAATWTRATAPTCRTSASPSRSRWATRSSTARSRGSSCSSAWSGGRPGACSRARPASRTGSTRRSGRSWPTWMRAGSRRRSCSPARKSCCGSGCPPRRAPRRGRRTEAHDPRPLPSVAARLRAAATVGRNRKEQ